jgi:4-hydroxy-2-oxoglutarate aldolase
MSKELRGVFPPLTTPFSPDGSVALDLLRQNIARYNGTRVAGYVVVGSTGESVLLQDDEIERIWATAREAAVPEKILIAGTGVDSTAETIARTRSAAKLGYDFALVKTPYYFKPQMSGAALAEHFFCVAEASAIPIIIYAVPQFTGIIAEAEWVARAAEHPNVAGIKDSSGNIQRVSEIIHSTPSRFRTLVGSAPTFYPSLAMGAVGGILGVADFLPDTCVELYEAFSRGESGRARALQYLLLEPGITIVGRLGPAGVKYAMDLAGYRGGAPRAPLLPLSDAQRRLVEVLLTKVADATVSR